MRSQDPHDRAAARPAFAFGRIDLFCLFAVVPMTLAAVIMIVGGLLPVALVLIFLALLVLVFDSWVNRPDPR
ncbi:hypothetical protein ACTG9Q_25245 [Actinokineospora sp. 24-640]